MKHTIKSIIALLFISAGLPAVHAQRIDESNVQQYQKLNQVLYLISNIYVDTVNMPKLVEKAVVEMLGSLDPHSSYLSADDLKTENEDIEGNFEGIGIEFNVLKDTIIVVNTIPGGPSEQVGLMPGDRIVWVNGENKVGIKMTEVPKVLRGAKGTIANLRVARPGVMDTLDFRIVRDKIPMYSLDAAYKIDDNTGYIKINRFMTTTNDELQKALREMPGIDGLVLDLRGNGGGLLDQAFKMASNFLEPNSLVVYTEGRAMPRQEAFTEGNGAHPLYENGKLVVLVDEHSASASEIVAGAIQDWDRGLVVGRRTFGKGLVQQQIELNDGSAIRLTIAHYYTPAGRSIQRPYTQGDIMSYYREFADRYTSGEITDGKAVVADSTDVYKTLKKGRTVYGGGGISPDITVPMDTSDYSNYWGELVRKGVLLETVITELDQRRADYTRDYPDFATYAANFRVSDAMMGRLEALARERGVKEDPEGLARSRHLIQVYLKALIAQRLWDTTEYYRVVNGELDREFKAAVEALQQVPKLL